VFAAVQPFALKFDALYVVVVLAVFQVTLVLLATVTVVFALLAIHAIAAWAFVEFALGTCA
jgi:hypothetical protein